MEGSHANLRLQGDLPDERLKYGITYIHFIPHGAQRFGGRLMLKSATKTAISMISSNLEHLERRQFLQRRRAQLASKKSVEPPRTFKKREGSPNQWSRAVLPTSSSSSPSNRLSFVRAPQLL